MLLWLIIDKSHRCLCLFSQVTSILSLLSCCLLHTCWYHCVSCQVHCESACLIVASWRYHILVLILAYQSAAYYVFLCYCPFDPLWCHCHWVAIIPVFISIILNNCCHFIINCSCHWHCCCALMLAHVCHFAIGNMLSFVIAAGDGHYLHNMSKVICILLLRSNHSYDKYSHTASFKQCYGGWQ